MSQPHAASLPLPAPMPVGPGLPKALGIYDQNYLFDVNGERVAIPWRRMSRGIIRRLYRGNEALLAATWPSRRRGGWSHDNAAMMLAAACGEIGICDPARLGFRVLIPWRSQSGRRQLLTAEQWQQRVSDGRSRQRAA